MTDKTALIPPSPAEADYVKQVTEAEPLPLLPEGEGAPSASTAALKEAAPADAEAVGQDAAWLSAVAGRLEEAGLAPRRVDVTIVATSLARRAPVYLTSRTHASLTVYDALRLMKDL